MNKEKILVYSYFFHPHENANTNVLKPVLKELCKTYDVDVFTCDYQRNLPAMECYEGMRVYRFRRKLLERFVRKMFGIMDNSIENVKAPLAPLKRTVWRLMHALFTRSRLERILTEYPVREALVQRLAGERYKALITASAPIIPQRDALALAEAGLLNELSWFAYFTDPHATFIGLTDQYEALMEKEMDIYRMADAVFLPPELYEDNMSHPLDKYRKKTIPVAFANLRPLPQGERPACFIEGKMNCVYTGSLFSSTVRNPAYFYQMIQACDDRFQFHIVCNYIDGANRALKQQYVDTNPNIHWYDGAPLGECLNMMCWADVLINLGNRCTNQTPSKIFDYISAGRPIVNVHPLENDTAKRYLGPYPLTLNIREKETPDPDDTQRFVEFSLKHKEDSVDFEEVRRLYSDMTPPVVAAKFARQIDRPWQPHDRRASERL